MKEIVATKDVGEAVPRSLENYKEIKPTSEISTQDAKNYWDNEFKEKTEIAQKAELEIKIEKTTSEYFEDLREKSDYPNTIPEKPFDASELKPRSPEENTVMREEFDDVKADLKQQWSEANDTPWPKYDKNIYSANDRLIRKAGSDYDAHHIQPLSMGGKNEAENITPLSAEKHYDRQGVHSPESPYSQLEQLLGEM